MISYRCARCKRTLPLSNLGPDMVCGQCGTALQSPGLAATSDGSPAQISLDSSPQTWEYPANPSQAVSVLLFAGMLLVVVAFFVVLDPTLLPWLQDNSSQGDAADQESVRPRYRTWEQYSHDVDQAGLRTDVQPKPKTFTERLSRSGIIAAAVLAALFVLLLVALINERRKRR